MSFIERVVIEENELTDNNKHLLESDVEIINSEADSIELAYLTKLSPVIDIALKQDSMKLRDPILRLPNNLLSPSISCGLNTINIDVFDKKASYTPSQICLEQTSHLGTAIEEHQIINFSNKILYYIDGASILRKVWPNETYNGLNKPGLDEPGILLKKISISTIQGSKDRNFNPNQVRNKNDEKQHQTSMLTFADLSKQAVVNLLKNDDYDKIYYCEELNITFAFDSKKLLLHFHLLGKTIYDDINKSTETIPKLINLESNGFSIDAKDKAKYRRFAKFRYFSSFLKSSSSCVIVNNSEKAKIYYTASADAQAEIVQKTKDTFFDEGIYFLFKDMEKLYFLKYDCKQINKLLNDKEALIINLQSKQQNNQLQTIKSFGIIDDINNLSYLSPFLWGSKAVNLDFYKKWKESEEKHTELEKTNQLLQKKLETSEKEKAILKEEHKKTLTNLENQLKKANENIANLEGSIKATTEYINNDITVQAHRYRSSSLESQSEIMKYKVVIGVLSIFLAGIGLWKVLAK